MRLEMQLLKLLLDKGYTNSLQLKYGNQISKTQSTEKQKNGTYAPSGY